jgi:methyl-accepting chemotaxis protein
MNVAKLNISTRLRGGLGLIIAFMVLLTITGIFSLSGINSRLEQIIKVNNAKIFLANKMKNATATIDKGLMTILMVHDETTTREEQKKMTDARAAFQDSFDKLAKIENSPKGKEMMNAIKENFAIAQNANDKVLESVAAGNINSATLMLTGSMQITNMLSESCDELVKFQQERTDVAAKEARGTYVRARYFLLIIGAAVFAFALFLASFLLRSITKPLEEGVTIAKRIAGGDLTIRMEGRTRHRSFLGQ